MIDFQSIQIVDFGATGDAATVQNLQTLYTTIQGTVPLDREFGLDVKILDLPLAIAKGKLIVEYTQKTRRYYPNVSVQQVIFEGDPQHGTLKPKVVIRIESE